MRLSALTTLAAAATLCAAAAFASATDRYDRHGAMVAHGTDTRRIYLVFSADSMFEGAPAALDALESRGLKANFFFTGNFLGRPGNSSIVRRIIDSGHYVGGHSNRHLLLADWDRDRTPLVTADSMIADIDSNLTALASFGVARTAARWFMPPFEWISASQAAAIRDSLGLEVINPTPEIQTFRDYTVPGMPEYASSDSMLHQLYDHERREGLAGAFIILHLGTQDVRTDKLYHHLPAILDSLGALGYSISRLP